MHDHPIIKLHHNEGDYIVGEVLNESQLRVLDSNITSAGLVLTKCTRLSWSQAEECGDNGSLVSPFELVVWNEAAGNTCGTERSV